MSAFTTSIWQSTGRPSQNNVIRQRSKKKPNHKKLFPGYMILYKENRPLKL